MGCLLSVKCYNHRTGTARLGGNGANLAVPLLIPDGLGSWPASACTAMDGSLGTSPNIGAALC